MPRLTQQIRYDASARDQGSDTKAAAMRALLASGYAGLARVTCEVDGDCAVLCGSVPSYHLKQLAQVCVQRVEGVGRVRNLLAVSR